MRGVVVEQKAEGRLAHPIAGATVLTEHGDVAVTDLDGYFTISVASADRELTVTAPGHVSRTIRLAAGDELLRVELAPASGSEVIEVTGRAPEETKPLSYQLTADEIRFLPGAANDILRAAQILPGVARIPYAFGGLVLRGTSPRDTAVFLDGIEVPIAFHFGGITSFYPSYMLETLTLTSGGFDASAGRAQGGLVTLTTREPRTDRWRVGGSIGLLDSGAFAEGPVGGGGVILGVRRSYLDTIVSPFVEDDTPLPSYWDAQVRMSFGDPGKRGRVTPMIFTAIDRVASDEVTVTSLFVRAAAPYLRVWGPLSLRVVPWAGWTQLTFSSEEDNGVRDTIRRPTIPGGVRSELVRDYRWGHVRGGLDLDAGYLAQTEIDAGPSGRRDLGSRLWWADLALWGETRLQLDEDRFSIKPGVRVDLYGLSGELVVDPRLNIAQRLTPELTLRQAIGRYHQPPIPADVDPTNGNPDIGGSYFDQASLGVDAELGTTFASLTAFAGYGHDIGVQVPDPRSSDQVIDPNFGGLGPTFQLLLEKSLGFSSYRENLGRARTVGTELLVKRHVGRWFFLAAYTLSWSQRTDDVKHPDPLSKGLWRPFELDQRHNLNVAASVALTNWRFGARIQLVSGNPYSPSVADEYGVPTTYPFAGRLPAFFHLDVRADRKWRRSWADINLFFDIQNVTNRRNVEGREFGYDDDHMLGYDEDLPGLPILPFIGVELAPR